MSTACAADQSCPTRLSAALPAARWINRLLLCTCIDILATQDNVVPSSNAAKHLQTAKEGVINAASAAKVRMYPSCLA